jgi:hypothetical protein
MKRVALILLLSQHVLGDKVKLRKHRKTGGVHGRMLSGEAGDSCQYANDNICDVPDYCYAGTDTTDCCSTVFNPDPEQILQDGIRGCNCGSAWYPNTVLDADSGCVCDASRDYTQTGNYWLDCGCIQGLVEVNGECCSTVPPTSAEEAAQDGIRGCNCGSEWYPNTVFDADSGCVCDASKGYTQTGSNWYECGCPTGFEEVNGECTAPILSLGGLGEQVNSCPGGSEINGGGLVTARGFSDFYFDRGQLTLEEWHRGTYTFNGFGPALMEMSTCPSAGNFDDTCSPIDTWIQTNFEPTCLCQTRTDNSNAVPQIFDENNECVQVTQTIVESDTSCGNRGDLDERMCKQVGHWQKRFSLEPFFETPLTQFINTGNSPLESSGNQRMLQLFASDDRDIGALELAKFGQSAITTDTISMDSEARAGAWKHCIDTTINFYKDGNNGNGCRVKSFAKNLGLDIAVSRPADGTSHTEDTDDKYEFTSFCSSAGFNSEPDVPGSEWLIAWDTREFQICRCAIGEKWTGSECDCDASKGFSGTSGSPCSCQDGYKVLGDTCVEICLPGQELTGTTCTNCDAGKYSVDGQACINCGAGKYNEQEGSTAEAACKDCDAGKYNDQLGQDACKDCAAGKYNEQEGQETCTNCAKGKYNTQEGSTAEDACTDCDVGTYSVAGEACNPCATGRYNFFAGQECIDVSLQGLIGGYKRLQSC